VTNSYLLALAATLILGGKLGDRFGRRTYYLVGVVGFTVASVAIGLAASSDAIVGNAPVQDGGVAGGLQATTLQIGGALGTSVLVSVISAKVGATLRGELTGAGVPAALAERLQAAKDAVAMGVAPVSGDMPGRLRAAVVEGSGAAFMNGVHAAVVVGGVLCLVGAALAAIGLRAGGIPSGH
jgi:MFS family permease